MRNTFFSTVALATALAVLIGCNATPIQNPAPGATPAFHTEFTIQDVMESVIDPSADYIWDSVSTTVGAQGIVEKAPKDDKEWAEVRRNAVIIMEASNLLKLEGRKAARPGTKSIAPGVEEEPEAIEKLMAADRPGWNKAAESLYEAAAILLKAAEAKDKDKILDAGNTLDEACEGCHLKFWYPNQTEILKRNAKELADEEAAKAKK